MGPVRGPLRADTEAQRLGLELPDEPTPVRFLNTIWADRLGLHDDLGSVLLARQWLDRVGGLNIEHVSELEVESLRAVRDCLRRVASHMTADQRTTAPSTWTLPDALAQLNWWADEPAAHPGIEIVDRAVRLRAFRADTATQVTAHLVRDGLDYLARDDSHPLRTCDAPGCPLFFVRDQMRRVWCSPGCGNRARAARHYARHRLSRP